MKLAYFSCHAILEYDELRLFEALNIDYFSFGSYVFPTEPVDPIRPALTRNNHYDNIPPRDGLTKEFIDQFDTILVMHIPEWIITNWELFKGKRVIWRTIGQSTSAHEAKLLPFRNQGLQIVRYSPREMNINGYIGQDAMIRFYKDPDEYKNWQGNSGEVVTISQDMKNRGEFTNYKTYMQIIEGIPTAKIYGTKNESLGDLSGGFLTYDGMKNVMRQASVYLYTHSQPACYTLNFIEAMLTGVPIVAIGPKLAESLKIANNTYEIPDIIQNGVNGYYSDDIEELKGYIKMLLMDKQLAKRIGDAGRHTAKQLFGMDTIKQQWKDFLQI
jgi:hypothetical protein